MARLRRWMPGFPYVILPRRGLPYVNGAGLPALPGRSRNISVACLMQDNAVPRCDAMLARYPWGIVAVPDSDRTPSPQKAPQPASDTRDAVLRVLDDLRRELHPRQLVSAPISPTDLLERDLGIDSLARVELLLRLERSLGLHLSGDRLMAADTVSDLLKMMAAGSVQAEALAGKPVQPLVAGAAALPERAGSILEALEFHTARTPDRIHIHLLKAEGGEVSISYRELWSRAQAVAAELRDRLVAQGQMVAIMLPTSAEFFSAFLGVLLVGGVPVPIYPPARRSQIEDHLRRQAAILRNAEAVALIVSEEAGFAGRMIHSQVETIRHVLTPAQFQADPVEHLRLSPKPEDVAMLQYTSGSTGDPKGVVLTHANLLANIRGLGRVFEIGSDDVVVSWLPLYHDMGLIGAWLGSLYHACPLVVMPPLSFLARPERWLWAIHRFRGTLSAAPNFGYELCLGKVRDEDIAGLDLSTWRMAGNGAEAVRPETLERFAQRYEKFGFRRASLTPMYGLAENAVALTIALPATRPRIDRIDRDILMREGRAEPTASGRSVLALCDCGPPIPGHEVRIVGAGGQELADRWEGEIEFLGPSATSGYHRNPEKTKALLDGGWRRTGDLGYIAEGSLYVTGRVKDIIIRAGRNLYPDELENAVGDIEGIRKGRVAIFAASDPGAGTERLVVVAETRETDPPQRLMLQDQIRHALVERIDIPPDDVVLVQPGSVLKTANGKIRRAACQELYAKGRLDRPPPALWQQIVGLLQASIYPGLRRARLAFRSLLFAIGFQVLYRLFGLLTWPLVVFCPGIRRRRRVFRHVARLFLGALGLTPNVQGYENISRSQPNILACNHSSYLDGLVLSAILPDDYAFVAKRELTTERLAGPFLRALGAVFVERVDIAGRIEDSRQLIALLKAGQSLIMFPEGTFDRRPGLRLFSLGTFVAAAEAGVPVIPVTLRGTRNALREESWLAQRSRIEVIFAQPLLPGGAQWKDALDLRDRVRQTILDACGEPDLIEEVTALRMRAASREEIPPD